MASIFSRIIAGEIPCYKIAEDEHNFAFLDISPLAEGHTLCVPKHETDYIFDLSDEEYQSLTLFAKRVAKAVGAAMPCQRVGVAVLGMEVPHAHIHLVPLQKETDLLFTNPKKQLTPEQFADIAARIREQL